MCALWAADVGGRIRRLTTAGHMCVGMAEIALMYLMCTFGSCILYLVYDILDMGCACYVYALMYLQDYGLTTCLGWSPMLYNP